jgi:hypothetical protein
MWFADHCWRGGTANVPVDTAAAIHVLKLKAREFSDHPDYRPVWDSNELYLA